MAYVYSKLSKERLASCDIRIQNVFYEVIKHVDCTILQGHRSIKEQQALFAQGRTKSGSIVTQIDGIKKIGMHNYTPSKAIDAAPYPLNWNDLPRFIYFAGFVMGIASRMGILLRWGGDWDSDEQQSDEKFRDFPHFEVIG
jgi:peptidoglycan L-alanyl-D-glutamate endopeptidase CwlK